MKTLIIIPTYNEKGNIGQLLEQLRDLHRDGLEVLVVDDLSPDGTADIVRAESRKPGLSIHLLSRSKKEGLGKAYAAGFQWGLRHSYDFFISMDADLSHRPVDLPKLLDASLKVDVVIGSRYIPGGRVVGWNWKRQLNSRGANIITRMALGLQHKDVTAGFKRYTRKFVESLDFKHVISSGYAFQVEMIFQAEKNGFSIQEVPIVFVDRQIGHSKISGELRRSAKIVWRLFLRRQGLRQFVKFALVGLFNTGVDWVIFSILRVPLSGRGQWGRQLAKAGSFIVAATSSYILNRHWTFRSTDKQIARQAARFMAVSLIGLVANNAIFYVVTSPNLLRFPDIYGLIIATAGVTFWNFFANKRWTFS